MSWKNKDSVIQSMTSASEIFKRYQNPNANETFGELYPIIAKGNPKLQDILAYQSSESGNLRDLPQNEALEELLQTIGTKIGSKTTREDKYKMLLPRVGSTSEGTGMLNILLKEYEDIAGGELEPLYDISSGDSTMVTPYDALLELLPEYESLGQIDKLNFFKEGRESIIKDVPAGAGFDFLQSLVPRAKRGE